MKTWMLDAVNIRNGTLMLFACTNRVVSTQIHFGLGKYHADDFVLNYLCLNHFSFKKKILLPLLTVSVCSCFFFSFF